MLIDAGTAVLKFANSDIGKLLIKIILFNTAIKLATSGITSLTKKMPVASGLLKSFIPILGDIVSGSHSVKDGFALMGGEVKKTVMALSPLAKGGLIVGGLATVSFIAYDIYKKFISVEGQVDRANKRLEENKKIMSDIDTKTSEAQSEYDDLMSRVDKLSEHEKTRLEYLEEQLRILKEQKKIEAGKASGNALESFTYETNVKRTVRKGASNPSGYIQVNEKKLLKGAEAVKALTDNYAELKTQLKDNVISNNEFVNSLNDSLNSLYNVFDANMQVVASGGELSAEQEELNLKFGEMSLAVFEAGGKLQYLDANTLAYMSSAYMAREGTTTLSDSLQDATLKFYGLESGTKQADQALALMRLKAIALADGGIWRAIQTNGVGAILSIAQSAGIASTAVQTALDILKNGYPKGMTGGAGLSPAEMRKYAENVINNAIDKALEGVKVDTSNIVDTYTPTAPTTPSYTPPKSTPHKQDPPKKKVDYKKKLREEEEDLARSYRRRKITSEKYYERLKALYKRYYKKGRISYKEYLDHMDKATDDFIERQKNAFENMMDDIDLEIRALDMYADMQTKGIDDKIDALNKEKEAIQEKNEEQEKAIELERLQDALAKARSKKIRVYKEGIGFVYDTDTEAVTEAQQALDDFKREELHEAELKRIDSQIEALEKEKKAWQDYVNEYKELQDKLHLEMELGMTLEEFIQDNKIKNLDDFVKAYRQRVMEIIELQKQMQEAEEQIRHQAEVDEWNARIEKKYGKLEHQGVDSDGKKHASSSGDKLIGYIEKANKDVISSLPKSEQDKVNKWNDSLKNKITQSGVIVGTDDKGRFHYAKTEEALGNILNSWNTTGKAPSKPSKPSKTNKPSKKHASGSAYIPFSQFSTINERGVEMLINPNVNDAYLTKGTGVIPHNLTQNLMEIGKYNLAGLKNAIRGNDKDSIVNQYFDKLILPNVTDANSFINELKQFKNMALQESYNRI